MNELNKLIEQYERENPGEKATYQQLLVPGKVWTVYTDKFVLWLATRPTCGVEQRLFLDEVEKFQLSPSSVIRKENVHLRDYVDLCNYTRIDFQKVIKGE